MSTENRGQIAFIICGNDTFQLEECQYYLEKLRVPENMSCELLVIDDAESMAEGYARGMEQSEAKYKAYLHQDVRIINPDFLIEMIRRFEEDSSVGIMGMIGRKEIPYQGLICDNWEYGKVATSVSPFFLEGSEKLCEDENHGEGRIQYGQMVDGLLIMTQYDIPWREDIFTGWDFYDASQCMEFLRAGYKVGVPVQQTPWVWHDSEGSRFGSYDQYRKIFLEEYQDMVDLDGAYHQPYNVELEQALSELEKYVWQLAACRKWGEIDQIYEQYGKMLWSSTPLCKLYNVRKIHQLEGEQAEGFCEGTMSVDGWIRKMDQLKNMLKRIEFDHAGKEEWQQFIKDCLVSEEAVRVIMICYVKDKEKVNNIIGGM